MDTLQDIRNEMALEIEKAGIPVDKQHHEVATAGQAEIDIRFAPLKVMSDSMQYYKYIIRNVARKHNKTATFMPNRCSPITAPACTPTSRCGRTGNRCSPETVTPA